MSIIQAREKLLLAMQAGISPTIPAIENFLEEVNDFLTRVNDYDEWDADKAAYETRDSVEPTHQPAITVEKLRRMAGYAS